MTQLSSGRISAVVAEKVWLRVNLHDVALHTIEHVSPGISGIVSTHLHCIVRHIGWLEGDSSSSLHAIFNHHAFHATCIGVNRGVFHHFGFEISGILSSEVGTHADRSQRDATIDGWVERWSCLVTDRPSDGTCYVVERCATCGFHNRKRSLNVTIVRTVANHDIYCFCTTCNGVADGLCLCVVGLTVNRSRRDVAICFHRYHSTLSRRNGEDGSSIHLRPIGPVGIGKFTIGCVEVELHVDSLTIHLSLSNIDACRSLVSQDWSTVLALEIPLDGHSLGAVSQSHCVCREDRSESDVSFWSVFSSWSIVSRSVVPCGECVTLLEELAVEWQCELVTFCPVHSSRSSSHNCVVSHGEVDGVLLRHILACLHCQERTVVGSLDGQRRSTTCVVSLRHIRAVVLPTVLSNRSRHHISISIGDGCLSAGIRTVSEGDFHATFHSNDALEVRHAVVAVIFTTDYCHCRSIVDSHTANGAIFSHSNSKTHGCALHLFIGSQECSVLIVHNDTEVLKGIGIRRCQHSHHQQKCIDKDSFQFFCHFLDRC